MTMRSYDDDDFRPWYVRDTKRYLQLSLEARGLVAELLRKWDRHGRLVLSADPIGDLAFILRTDEDTTRRAFVELTESSKAFPVPRLMWDVSTLTLSDPDFLLRERRGKSAERMARKRERDAATATPASANDSDHPPESDVTSVTSVTCDEIRHHAHNPSPSSLVLSDLSGSLPRSEEPTCNRAREGVADALAPPPGWWDGVCRTVSAGCLGSETALSASECWLAYAGHRNGKGRKPDRNDAVQWLTQVMVPKAKEAIRQAARDRERDAKYDATRARPPGHIEPLTVTPDQAKRDADALAARIAARKAKGAA